MGRDVPRHCIKEVPHSNPGGLAANLRCRESLADLVQVSNGEYFINTQTCKLGQLLWHKNRQFMSLEEAASVPFGPPGFYPNPHR
jgi:hypothetical protein